jgi:hypothetical protein
VRELATCVDETGVEFEFRDVAAKCSFCHEGVSGCGYCPTSLRCAGGCRELLSHTD